MMLISQVNQSDPFIVHLCLFWMINTCKHMRRFKTSPGRFKISDKTSSFAGDFWVPFYEAMLRLKQIRFHSSWQRQTLLQTAGSIWCGCPMLGFRASFNTCYSLWPVLWPCMWMTGDSGQTGEVGEVQGEMEGDQQMESVRDGELYI